MDTLQKVAQIANILAPIAALAGGAAAIGGGGEGGRPDDRPLPPGVVGPPSDIPKPEESLIGKKSETVKAAKGRRGRASTMLSAGRGGPFESFGGPSRAFFV
jgi:hypothetical protein